MTRFRVLAALGLIFFVVHLRSLPRSLEDIDSINLALGVESYDVGAHRPHPPGYPVLIAASKVSTWAIRHIWPSWDRDRTAAVGLAVWGLVAGTLAGFAIAELWAALGLSSALSILAAVLAVVSPLFWFTAARPLSDTPGLVAAVAVQAWLIAGLLQRRDPGHAMPRIWRWAAFGAGLIIGIRSQTMWMTGPLLAWCAGRLLVDRRWRDALTLVGLAAAGALVWAIPMIPATGGWDRYLWALKSQGALDFGAIEMLATSPTWKLFKASMSRTFMDAWQWTPLAKFVLALALIGTIRLLWRAPKVIGLLALGFLPYLIFHLAFQETVTLRYGLPLVVPIAGLAVAGAAALGSIPAAALTAVAAGASLWVGQPALEAYGREGAPVFRAFQDMQRALPASGPAPLLHMHHQVWHGIQRVADWYRPYWDSGSLPFPKDREWLDVVRPWTAGETRPVWFLAELTRNDLVLFDRRARAQQARYEYPMSVRALIGGVRLDGLSWWTIQPPAWMLGSGWSLTPEVAGMTSADQAGPSVRPADAFLRRGAGLRRVMIGGRWAGASGDGGARVTARLDGQPVAEWVSSPDNNPFLEWITVPDLPAGGSPYAHLTVQASPFFAGRRVAPVLLEQFDAARADDVIWAFADGWHEQEEDPRTGKLWRWTSSRSTIRIEGAPRDLRLVLTGESPRRYFDRAPTVVVRAGSRELARFSPSADFEQAVEIPAAALAASNGQVTIETDLTFVPGAHGVGDQRKLGLKLFSVTVASAPPSSMKTPPGGS